MSSIYSKLYELKLQIKKILFYKVYFLILNCTITYIIIFLSFIVLIWKNLCRFNIFKTSSYCGRRLEHREKKRKEYVEKVAGKLRKLLLCVINKVVLSRRRKELIPPAYLVVVMSSTKSSSEGIA